MIGGRTRSMAIVLAVVLAALSTVSCTLAEDDTDGDELSDSWELQYFGDLKQGSDGDPDDDGFTNLEEFNAQTDPTDSTSKPNPPHNRD